MFDISAGLEPSVKTFHALNQVESLSPHSSEGAQIVAQ
jgi:hypothetical protein